MTLVERYHRQLDDIIFSSRESGRSFSAQDALGIRYQRGAQAFGDVHLTGDCELLMWKVYLLSDSVERLVFWD